MIYGRADSCLKKGPALKAKAVHFECVEAYPNEGNIGVAAGATRCTVLSTEEAWRLRHSVTYEIDFMDPYKAALRAFCLRGHLILGSADTDDGDPAEISYSHVSDLWCSFERKAGPHPLSDATDDLDADAVWVMQFWVMQLSETPTIRDLCCQQLLVQRLQEMEDSQAEGIRICSHGLSGTPVGSRYFMIAAAKVHLLKQAIRQNWPEFQDAEGNIYFVHPQPQDTLRPSWRTCVHVIVEFLPEDAVGDIGVVPALEESVVWDAFGNANAKHEACYYASQLHFGDIATKFEHLCMRAKYRCIVRAEGYRMHPEETTTIVAGACIQLHALPQVSAPSNEFVEYFWHGHQFLEATANLLGHWVMPAVTWSFHLLTEDGYQGHRDYNPSNTEFQSGDQVATVMYHLWQELTPGALAFTGLIHIGDRSTLHFLGFPLDSEYYPGLVWRDVNQVPLISALWLPSVASVRDFSQALAIGDESLDPSTLAVTSEDFLYQPDDRFKPRVGKLYFLRPFLPSDDEEVSLIQKQITSSNLQPDEVEGDAGWGVEECSSPLPSQAKPNPDIRVAFDQDIPITRRTSEGTTETIGRIIPPPRWEEHTLNRAAAAAGAHFRTASGQLTVQFRSWLVKHDDRRAANGQSRDFTLRAQLVVQIREKLKRVWNDHIGQGDLFQVIVVRPTPFADQNGETFLHIIAEVNRRPRSPLQPVLMAMRELASLSVSRPIWCVGLLPEDFDTEDVFDLCLPVCERHQLLIPRGGTTRGWLGPRQSRRAHAGLFIPIWWDERLTVQEAQRLHPGDDEVEESILLQRAAIIHDDSTSLLQVPGPAIHPWPPSPFGKAAEDVASLMQRPAPSSAPNLIPTFLAGLHLPLRTVLVDMDRPVTETVADFWPYETDSSSVVALYPVTDPPVSTRTGPQPMLIAHQSQDRFEQEHPDDVLAVVTVSFQRDLASRERRHRFKVLWVPWRGTRANYIDYFRMTGHCRMTHIICFLYLNNVIWPETDGAIRSLTNGDHLRLQIRADDNTDWCSFEYTENAARQRRIFESSPEPADDPAEAERSSSSVSEPRSRSRSRNPPDEESDSHSLFQEQPEEVAAVSLLQLHAAMTSSIWAGDSEDNAGLRTNATTLSSNRPKPGGRRVLQDITNLAKGSMMLGQPPDKELVGDRKAEGPDVTTLRPPPHVFDRWCGDADVSGTSEFHCLHRTPPVPIELARAVELPPPPERIPIDLASTLEHTSPNRQTSDGLDFRPAASLLELLDSHLLLTSFDFTAPLGWHHTSYDWLGYPWWEVDEPLQEVHIYTDGSAREEGTGAAFIAFGLQSGSWRLLGSFSQTLPSHWEAHHAEDLALWYANKFLYDVCRIAHNRGFELPWDLVCHYDSMVAGGKAFGQYTAHTHVACAHATRCMIQLCDTAYNTTIRGLHVKGHNGDPGNEAANTLAEAAACGSPTHPHDPLLASIAAGDFGFEFSWAWALFYPPFGPYWHELQLHLPLSGPRSSSYSDLSAVPHEPSTEEEAGKVCMQIATANVLTLKPKKAHKQASEETACGLGSASSQDAFFKQCHEEGIHLLACQETRLKRGPRCNEWYFFRHSSATDHGWPSALSCRSAHFFRLTVQRSRSTGRTRTSRSLPRTQNFYYFDLPMPSVELSLLRPTHHTWGIPNRILHNGGLTCVNRSLATTVIGQSSCLAIRSFCNIAKERHWPFAVLYIDLKHAFHHLIRELLFGITDPEGFTEVLRAVTTSGGDQDEVKRLCSEATLRHFGVSSGLQRLLADVHTNTWCTIGEGGPALRTNRGSRPGSPLLNGLRATGLGSHFTGQTGISVHP